MPQLANLSGYPRFWAASTVSAFGSNITLLAMQILATLTLHATGVELGLLGAARWLSYLLFGLLCAIPALYFADVLTIPALIAFTVVFGTLSLCGDAADQSFLPRLVPARCWPGCWSR